METVFLAVGDEETSLRAEGYVVYVAHGFCGRVLEIIL
jgi:hypothetical protein